MKRSSALTISTLLLVLLLALPGQAFEQTPSHFLYFGLGVIDLSYPDEIQRLLNWLKNQGHVFHRSLEIEAPGFYWTYGPKTLVGPVLNLAVDRYNVGPLKLQVNQFLVGLSSMYFLSGEFGRGPFLRSDVGLAWASVDSVEGATSHRGIGALIGGGYAARVAGGTRSLLNLHYTIRKLEGESYRTITISASVLL